MCMYNIYIYTYMYIHICMYVWYEIVYCRITQSDMQYAIIQYHVQTMLLLVVLL